MSSYENAITKTFASRITAAINANSKLARSGLAVSTTVKQGSHQRQYVCTVKITGREQTYRHEFRIALPLRNEDVQGAVSEVMYGFSCRIRDLIEQKRRREASISAEQAKASLAKFRQEAK